MAGRAIEGTVTYQCTYTEDPGLGEGGQRISIQLKLFLNAIVQCNFSKLNNLVTKGKVRLREVSGFERICTYKYSEENKSCSVHKYREQDLKTHPV